jgi:predicted outer membrane repeat protein
MGFSSWLRNRKSSAPAHGRRILSSPRPRSTFRPRLEALEDRMLPSTYNAATTRDLIADINAANTGGGTNTIVLTAPTSSPYVLTKVDNKADGANGLPVIAGKQSDNLTIVGNGDTIERSTASNTRSFRLFDVGSGSSLTVENVTLQGGLASGSGAAADGGAIYNQGTLTLDGATVQNNAAQGNGGGIYSSGATVTLSNTTLSSNSADYGGGICSSGATVTLSNTTLSSNRAVYGGGISNSAVAMTVSGGDVSNNSASVDGGGIYNQGTLVLSGVTVQKNVAEANYGSSGPASGGGIWSNGSLTIENQSTIQFNSVVGTGTGSGYGGGICIAGGTADISNTTIGSPPAEGYAGNTALGGYDQFTNTYAPLGPGAGYGGGVYVGGGTVTFTNDTIESNSAGSYIDELFEGFDDLGYGGGIYITTGAKVYLDQNTLYLTNNNTGLPPGATADIQGSYTLL